MDFSGVSAWIEKLPAMISGWLMSPAFYAQLALIVGSLILAVGVRNLIDRTFSIRSAPSANGFAMLVYTVLGHIRAMLLAVVTVLLLGAAIDVAMTWVEQSWLVRAAQGIAAIWLLNTAISRFVEHRVFRVVVRWTAIPIALLYVTSWLEPTIAYLETIDVNIGNIQFSAYSLARVLIFGSLLFWFGRVSNNAGQSVIRNQPDLDAGTRELFAKLFEAALYMLVFILLLQVMGVNLTTLAVFGGALGVGLGFGLQAIASNFISGIILLLDRSLKVGDHIELENGNSGTILSLNMRSTTLETYTGKVIVVPNETFITGAFTNWTHNNPKQRYTIEFQVAYNTDIEHLVDVLREVVASHPQVISGSDAAIEELPDAEIAGFGDSGIDILIEFWMEGIDDGRNRVGADLNMMIWKALREHGIEIPYPQREIRILDEKSL